MKEWHDELLQLDDLKNHKKNLDLVLEAFLTSDYANCQKKRTSVLLLFRHLQRL